MLRSREMIGMLIIERIVEIAASFPAYAALPSNFSANIEVAVAAGVDAETKMTVMTVWLIGTISEIRRITANTAVGRIKRRSTRN